MAVARGSRLGRRPSAGSATPIWISGPRPCRNASASASPANAPPPITMLRCAMPRLTLLRPEYSWAKQVHQTRASAPTTGRHPEVLALLGEPRRMATGAVLAAILRDAAQD